jgi:hypothetical protein
MNRTVRIHYMYSGFPVTLSVQVCKHRSYIVVFRMLNSWARLCRQNRRYLQKSCLTLNTVSKRYQSSQLQVHPQWSLIDEKVTIKGSSLASNLDITLLTSLKDEAQRINLQSECHYTTDSQGVFSTDTHAPSHGSEYTGVHSSGPLWSARPQKGSMVRLWPHDIMKPLQYDFVLKDKKTGEVLASEQISKSFVDDGVRRITVKTGKIRGTLFLPPKPGPGIITLYGGVNKGKVPEDRSGFNMKIKK